MTTRRALIRAYGDWLKRYQWDLFGTLTFRGFPSRSQAQNRFKSFISEIRHECGTPKFRYVQVAEKGSGGENLHFHILVGGLKKGCHLNIGKWCNKWRQIGGIAAIGKFERKKPGIFYLLKTLLPDEDFDITMQLPDIIQDKERR